MGQTSYPTWADVQEQFVAGGVTVSDNLKGQLPAAIAAAIRAFEGPRGADRVLLAGTTDQTRYFDPPEGGESLLRIDDLSATPTSVVYRPYQASPETLVVQQDYWLEPRNALVRKLPYSFLRFRRSWTLPLSEDLRQSIEVTGKWGWPEIPDDAWEAMRLGAAGLALVLAAAGQGGGVKSRRIEDFQVDYGSGPYSQQVEAWTGFAQETAASYRRVGL